LRRPRCLRHRGIRELMVTSFGYAYRRLTCADVPLLKDLLRVFGEAFDEVDTYQRSVPSDDYLRRAGCVGRLRDGMVICRCIKEDGEAKTKWRACGSRRIWRAGPPFYISRNPGKPGRRSFRQFRLWYRILIAARFGTCRGPRVNWQPARQAAGTFL
jgi:hypothetical protein